MEFFLAGFVLMTEGVFGSTCLEVVERNVLLAVAVMK